MTTAEWLRCKNMLADEFPSRSDNFNKPRWERAFKHVPYGVMIAAIDAYCRASNNTPTVDAIADKLPKGYGIKRLSEEHAHNWDDSYADGAVICGDCGRHAKGRCQCIHCTCPHENAFQEGSDPLWWHCDDCNASFKRTHAAPVPMPPKTDEIPMVREEPVRHTPDEQMWRHNDAALYGDDDEVPF